jgi:hypothetical protein
MVDRLFDHDFRIVAVGGTTSQHTVKVRKNSSRTMDFNLLSLFRYHSVRLVCVHLSCHAKTKRPKPKNSRHCSS